jgi:hypothetical protein
MDAFSYLSVLISIILGLGITQLLTGLGRLLQARAGTRLYAPAITWVAVLLLIHVQTWWTMFGLRGVRGWTFGAFLVVLLQPALLYLMAALAVPEVTAGAPVDLRANYFAHARPFFALTMLLLVVSIAKDLVLDGRLPVPLNLATHVVLFALCAAAATTRRERFHQALAPVVAVIFAVYVTVLFARLN